MNRYHLLILLCLIIVADCRRGRGRGSGGTRVGKTMGDGIVTLISDIRQGPESMPKGYKREIDRPEKEEYTLWYKFKNGLWNIVYLVVAVIVGGLLWFGFKKFTGVPDLPEDNIADRRQHNRSKEQRLWAEKQRKKFR